MISQTDTKVGRHAVNQNENKDYHMNKGGVDVAVKCAISSFSVAMPRQAKPDTSERFIFLQKEHTKISILNIISNKKIHCTKLFGTTRVGRYQKGKTNLDFTEARDTEWQWHQLGRMQVCISLQTDDHASTSPLKFFSGRMPFQQRQSTEGNNN